VSSSVPTTAVVVDTDAFSRLFVKRQPQRELRDRLIGRMPVVATQTRAELLAWPRLRSWGPTQAQRLRHIIDSVPTVPVTDDVVDAYVDLLACCTAQGHALGQKDHTGDRWIAATAVALDRPLFSLDGIFRNVPGLMSL
jgi:predicted nucleic acid-binding protein